MNSLLDSDNVNPDPTQKLEPMLVRLPPAIAAELRSLARNTRIRQSDYLREAVADLLAKYGRRRLESSRSTN